MDFVQNLVINTPVYAYIILFLAMFVEGEVSFLIAAIFAIEGFLNWWIIIAVTFAGVIIGDIAWYFLGRYSKSTRLGIWVSKKFVGYEDWLQDNFETRYFRLAFISKFLYYVNRLTPLLAGWQSMEFKKFFKIHLAAALGWLAFVFILGKFFGLIIDAIGVQVVLHRLYWVFLILAIVITGGEFLLKKLFMKKIRKK